MTDHDRWMHRCLQLARLGTGGAAPNPMVGAVLVHGDRILAEGWHEKAGNPHAEVECLRAFGEGPVPGDAVMYVNLEPCTHHGKTPPCADLLIERDVRHVVIAHRDPFPLVSGRGIARLRSAGVEVIAGILEDQARWLNRRFLTSVEQRRPYIILKWAQSNDGFLDQHPRKERGVQRISSPDTDTIVHRWRSEEQAILVGSRTVINDDPQLTVRHVKGRSPLRVVIDRRNTTPSKSRVYDSTAPTLLITQHPRGDVAVEQHIIDTIDDPIDALLGELDRRQVRSIMVEGGAQLLRHFIDAGLWDEARVITGPAVFNTGTRAPVLAHTAIRSTHVANDRIDLFLREGGAVGSMFDRAMDLPW
ncbi:MAG TPA: bifunctional diaminohydroxyphosphoribosylaminopyrimidine deaminase/5-amino-6-(5-phosphoribosylamino)uracil reductase RibD [Flavobacteriales bacterium]|nr:bifunctional diaminohydroxyphosphoribosylaminopyrimidine deaminase/5-amino-6-(5-phosphoribosylamino)uracil reductase RibD [Flavobacteriales bacterium]